MESVLEEARPEWAHVCPAFLTHGPSTNGRQASSLPRQILSRQTPTWAPRTLLCSLHSSLGRSGWVSRLPDQGPIPLPSSCVSLGKLWLLCASVAPSACAQYTCWLIQGDKS